MSTFSLPGLSDAAFLDLLAEQDIELRLQDDRLRINAPAGAVTNELKAEMVRRREMLLAVCRSARELHGTRIVRSPSIAANQAPLTWAQERLWLLERFRPGNFAYNIPEVFELPQPVDPKLLQHAIDTVTQRQEALRTCVIEAHGRVLQQVESSARIVLEVTDLSSDDLSFFEDADREAHLKRLLLHESRRPFDLTVAPLARLHLYRLGPDRRLLLVNLHHIIADRWSMRVLYRELVASYLAHAQGVEPVLPQLPIQYSDYAVWERSAAQARMQQQLQYWQRQLAALPEPLALPFARPAAPSPSTEGAICVVKLTPEDTAALRTLANANSATLYMVLLAAYCALLRRYTSATDMCIGSPVSARNYAETEPLIGLFVNTLVMRCKVPPSAGFLEVLRGVRDTVLDAHAHRDVPFQRILSSLQPEARSGSQAQPSSPLFQTMLAFDPLTQQTAADGTTEVELDPGFAKFDLTLQLREEPTRIAGWFEYRTDVADSAAMSRFAAAFVRLLRGILADPARPIENIDILAAEERRLLLHDWNATALPFPVQATIHQLFEEQAARSPGAIALVDGDRRWRYCELNRRANCIARALLAEGVSVESIVGIHLSRTAEMVAALLGVLKAGSAYLPLDPQYPEARLRGMVEDSGCAIVITDSEIGVFASVKALTIASLTAGVNEADDANPATAVTAQNLAYVIYTSGSTGKPKGVAIEHHSTVSFLTWGRKTFSPEVLRGTLASTSISFDLSVFEVFLPLTTGNTVILARDVLELPKLAAMGEVTLVNTVPSAATALLDAHAFPASVASLNLAGEPLSAELVDRLYQETGLTLITDLYGPTETTTYSTYTRRSRAAAASIGRPIANTRVYLLDTALQLVPLGMAGELFIAGEGVARGYLHRPELTAERFVGLRHLGEAGRAYRTGDLCRYNRDGTLVYLGRMDQQVKVNGFRIELGEVETVLRSHSSVDEAVVLAQQEGSGAVLVAAVRLAAGHSLDTGELLRHQAATLPPHMVARRIAAVEHFPHTANGKLDRARLSARLAETRTVSRTVIAPRDELERELLAIWQDGFLDRAIGIDDDFFQIGGHSLLALRIFSEIEARMDQRMMLNVLFHAPTVRLLANHIRAERAARRPG